LERESLIVNWKEFLKPNKKKMSIFILFNLIFFTSTFFGFIGLLETYSLTPVMIILAFFFGIPFILTTVFNLVGIFGLASIIIITIITIFYWHLLACIIVWIYDKISPKFPVYRPLTVWGISSLMGLVGLYFILNSFQFLSNGIESIFSIVGFFMGILAIITAWYFFKLKRTVLKFFYAYLILLIIFLVRGAIDYQINYQEPYSIFPMLITFSIILFNVILVLLARNYVNKKQVKNKPLFS
jgi:hypothetical protein